MLISTLVAERNYQFAQWKIGELENEQGLAFQAPSGYVFVFPDNSAFLRFLVDLAYGGISHETQYGKIETVDSEIRAFEVDKWVNPGWEIGDDICDPAGFMIAATYYLELKWLRKA